jgi:hypothetical protein
LSEAFYQFQIEYVICNGLQHDAEESISFLDHENEEEMIFTTAIKNFCKSDAVIVRPMTLFEQESGSPVLEEGHELVRNPKCYACSKEVRDNPNPDAESLDKLHEAFIAQQAGQKGYILYLKMKDSYTIEKISKMEFDKAEHRGTIQLVDNFSIEAQREFSKKQKEISPAKPVYKSESVVTVKIEQAAPLKISSPTIGNSHTIIISVITNINPR